MRYDISMGIGEPKTNIDFAALKARLKASIDQSVDKAQSSPPVSPASEQKSPKPDTPRTRDRGNRKDGSFKANELEDLKKKGDLYISTMENVLTQTKSVKGLMVLVDRVPSKGAKKRLSLKLSNGLQVLLPVDKDFSSKFNTLIDQWEKRIVEVLFDDAHREYFRDSLRETLKTKPEIAKGDFFSQYLEHFDCSALGDVVPVREKLVALWEEQCPATGHKLKNQKRQEEKFIVGEEYVLRSDPSKEYVITEISGDKIAYKSLEGGLVSYSTKEQFARFLKKKSSRKMRGSNAQTATFAGNPGKQESIPGAVSEPISSEELERGRQVEAELNHEMELWIRDIQSVKTEKELSELMNRAAPNGKYTDIPGFVIGKFFQNLLKRQDITSEQEGSRLKSVAFALQKQIAPVYLAKRAEIYPSKVADVAKDTLVADITSSGPAPDAATSNLDISSEPSMRPYDELMGKLGERKRDADLELTRLKSAVAAGLQEIMKLIPNRDESDAYIREERTQLIADFSAQIIIRLEKLLWTPEERKFFAETFVEKEIEGFLE